MILGISGISLGGMEGRTGSSSINTVLKCELRISAFCLGSVKSFGNLITPLDNNDNVEATTCDTFFAKYQTLLSCYETI